jgi:endogenous inhibitor of DNA gyrase (YacG/DUF329 family)
LLYCSGEALIRPRNCPICERELPATITGDSPLFPFCSLRCKQADLYRWMNGEYVIEEILTPQRLAEQDIPTEDA